MRVANAQKPGGGHNRRFQIRRVTGRKSFPLGADNKTAPAGQHAPPRQEKLADYQHRLRWVRRSSVINLAAVIMES